MQSSLTKDELLQVLWQVVRTHGTQRQAARAFGISDAYLGDVLHGKREPGGKLLAALGYQRDVRYVNTHTQR